MQIPTGQFFANCSTIVVMHTFRAAQPALLYLSPACILSVLITAAIRGELSDLWSYTEESAEEQDDEKNDEQDDAEDRSAEVGESQTLEAKKQDVLHGKAGDATPLTRRTRSSAKLAQPEAL